MDFRSKSKFIYSCMKFAWMKMVVSVGSED